MLRKLGDKHSIIFTNAKGMLPKALQERVRLNYAPENESEKTLYII